MEFTLAVLPSSGAVRANRVVTGIHQTATLMRKILDGFLILKIDPRRRIIQDGVLRSVQILLSLLLPQLLLLFLDLMDVLGVTRRLSSQGRLEDNLEGFVTVDLNIFEPSYVLGNGLVLADNHYFE